MPWPFSQAEPDFDTGFVAVPDSQDVVTALDVRLMGGNFVNTDQENDISITIVNTADEEVFAATVIAGQTYPPPNWMFMFAAGLKWQASRVGLTAKLWGYTV